MTFQFKYDNSDDTSQYRYFSYLIFIIKNKEAKHTQYNEYKKSKIEIKYVFQVQQVSLTCSNIDRGLKQNERICRLKRECRKSERLLRKTKDSFD